MGIVVFAIWGWCFVLLMIYRDEYFNDTLNSMYEVMIVIIIILALYFFAFIIYGCLVVPDCLGLLCGMFFVDAESWHFIPCLNDVLGSVLRLGYFLSL